MQNQSLPMPVTVTPYLHQQRAVAFACQRFGLKNPFREDDAPAANVLPEGSKK